MKHRDKLLITILTLLLLFLFVLDLGVGSIAIPIKEAWSTLIGNNSNPITSKIVIDIRLMKAIVAVAVGVSLSVSGLMMQTLFRNPMAGPYVLGISSGASLGVSIFILGAPLFSFISSPYISSLGIAGAAWVGSALILVVIGSLSTRIKDIMVILILGMMFSSGVSAIVQIFQYLSHEEALKSFIIWTMGSLGEVTSSQLWLFIPAVAIGLILSIYVIKPLNLLLLGEQYATTMGVNIKKSRNIIFISTSLLAGSVTAFCGPIGFIGLAVPHIARALSRNADHKILLPVSALSGGVMLLFCDIISKWLTLPINTITALLGIPVVVWVVIKNCK